MLININKLLHCQSI